MSVDVELDFVHVGTAVVGEDHGDVVPVAVIQGGAAGDVAVAIDGLEQALVVDQQVPVALATACAGLVLTPGEDVALGLIGLNPGGAGAAAVPRGCRRSRLQYNRLHRQGTGLRRPHLGRVAKWGH